MKVLIIHSAYKYKGGEDTVVAEEMELLKAQGVEVDLLQFHNDRNVLLNLLQLPFNIPSYHRVKRKLKEFEPDVVHIHNLHFAASASVPYAIKSTRTPFVITLHNYRFLCPSALLYYRGKIFLDSINQNFPWRAVKDGLYKNSRLLTFWLSFSMQIHKWIGTWKMCDCYIVLSEFSRKMFLNSKMNFKEHQIVVKPNFCSAPIATQKKTENFYLYVGRLSPEKGIATLLNVFTTTSANLKIAGDGPLKALVEKTSSEFKNVEYLGSVAKAEVRELLDKATALIFPSNWYEGMPLTIIEAFACSTPVIASRLGAMETMVEHEYNGLHFEVENEDDLKKKIFSWQNLTEQEKTRYQNNARETYERLYTPERNAQQLLSIYTSVIEKKTAPLLSYT
jgi:glycosyltransferase involved in cell wall biosynthesis